MMNHKSNLVLSVLQSGKVGFKKAAEVELRTALPQKIQELALVSGYCAFEYKIALQVFQSQAGDSFSLKTNWLN